MKFPFSALPVICFFLMNCTTTRGPGFTSYFSGSKRDVIPMVEPSVLLAGGAADRDDAMQWFLDNAGRGDIVIIRESGSDGYNQWFINAGAHSVRSILFTSREGAFQTENIEAIKHAEGIFFAGGDQAHYIQYLKDTPVLREVNNAIKRGVAIGGISAGLAILGEYSFSALADTISTEEALLDPYSKKITLEKDFLDLPILKNLITDSHFAEFDRMGRSIAFIARIKKDGWSQSPHGLGVSEDVAIGIDKDGMGRVFADDGAAYFLTPTEDPEVCEPRKPLTFSGMSVRKLTRGATLNFKTWNGTGGTHYILNVKNGVLSKPIY